MTKEAVGHKANKPLFDRKTLVSPTIESGSLCQLLSTARPKIRGNGNINNLILHKILLKIFANNINDLDICFQSN